VFLHPAAVLGVNIADRPEIAVQAEDRVQPTVEHGGQSFAIELEIHEGGTQSRSNCSDRITTMENDPGRFVKVGAALQP